MFISFYVGHVVAFIGISSAYLAKEFVLSDSEMAIVLGCIGFGGVITLMLNRQVDRFGRRKILLANLILSILLALLTSAAPNKESFVMIQIVFSALVGSAVTTNLVMITEYLPEHLRAKGQALGGLFSGLGSGWALILMSLLVKFDVGGEGHATVWRYLWMEASFMLLLVPFLWRHIVEPKEFHLIKNSGVSKSSHWPELFSETYRKQTLILISAFLLYVMGNHAIFAWFVYYPVKVLGLDQMTASIILVSGGIPGLLGYALGARYGDKIGRKKSIFVFCFLSCFFSAAYYFIPPGNKLVLAIGLWICVVGMLTLEHAIIVNQRTLTTELFPSQFRVTIQGILAFSTAASGVLSHFLTSWLINVLGGLTFAILALISLKFIASFVYLFLPETKGHVSSEIVAEFENQI